MRPPLPYGHSPCGPVPQARNPSWLSFTHACSSPVRHADLVYSNRSGGLRQNLLESRHADPAPQAPPRTFRVSKTRRNFVLGPAFSEVISRQMVSAHTCHSSKDDCKAVPVRTLKCRLYEPQRYDTYLCVLPQMFLLTRSAVTNSRLAKQSPRTTSGLPFRRGKASAVANLCPTSGLIGLVKP